MLCEKCGKNQATAYVRENINGKTRELHLCADCAAELGIGIFPAMDALGDFGLGSLLGSLFTQTLPARAGSVRRCPFCGSTLEDIANSAQAGCAECYNEFRAGLLPSIERIHGKTRHVGKVPDSAGKALKQRRRVEELKQRLADAVGAQEYEKAAKLRDEIRALEGDSGPEGKAN